jgi:hypothetical protein
MIQILETMHSGVSYWLIFEGTEIVGKYSTKSEAIQATKQLYPKLDGVLVTPIQP